MFVEVPERFRYVAFLADIHGNLPALVAVAASLPSQCFIVGLGDYVGYYTEPDEVCEWMSARAHVCIRGNHDRYVVGGDRYSADKEADYRVEWTKRALSRRSLRWLASLSAEALVALSGSGLVFRIRHASPVDEVNYFYPDTPLDVVPFRPSECLVLGHTHHPMARQREGMWIFNPGSVGQPRNYVPGAQYCLFDLGTRLLSFHCIDYDYAGYQQKLSLLGVREQMVSMLSRRKCDSRMPDHVFVDSARG